MKLRLTPWQSPSHPLPLPQLVIQSISQSSVGFSPEAPVCSAQQVGHHHFSQFPAHHSPVPRPAARTHRSIDPLHHLYLSLTHPFIVSPGTPHQLLPPPFSLTSPTLFFAGLVTPSLLLRLLAPFTGVIFSPPNSFSYFLLPRRQRLSVCSCTIHNYLGLVVCQSLKNPPKLLLLLPEAGWGGPATTW